MLENARLDSDETPAEHVRNALQMLGADSRGTDVDAIARRLDLALYAIRCSPFGAQSPTYILVTVALEVLEIDDAGQAVAQRSHVVRRLLRSALARLERPNRCFLDHARFEVTSTGLTAIGAREEEDDRCVFCGCTETSPCEIKRADLLEPHLAALTLYFSERGADVPDVVPCWWVLNTTEPVCSNPSCVAELKNNPGLRTAAVRP